jgi:hypothetical protein
MIDITTLLRLQIKLMTKGDRILYFYIISIIAFVLLKFYSFTLLWQIFLAVSNVYLVLLYNRDAGLKTFYKILNISEFKIHSTKICIVYLLSLLQLILLIGFSNEPYRPITFIVHFLSFYTSIIFYNSPAWLKLFIIICAFVTINLILYLFPLALSSILIFIIVTIIIIGKHNEHSAKQKPNLV